MIINSSSIESLKPQDYQDLSTKILNRNFNKVNDIIELSIIDNNGTTIITDNSFKDYTPIESIDGKSYKSINIDYVEVLKNYGFSKGRYTLKFSFQRNLIQNSTRKIFLIDEISPSRTEIRVSAPSIPDEIISDGIYDIQNQLFNSVYIKDFNLNFGNGVYSLLLNAQLDSISSPISVLLKLYEPLPSNIRVGNNFRIIEEIINPIEVEIDLGSQSLIVDDGIPLAGPNFSIGFDIGTSVQSEFKSYDNILLNGASSSSFNNLTNYLSGSFPLNLEFDNTNTPSGFHFENFIHFSSAVERLKNFEYKMRLIENYRDELSILEDITGDVTSSINFIKDKSLTEGKINKVIQNFDPYERFLYFESGAFCWPKYDNTKPYSNVSSSNSAVISWLGVEIPGYSGQYNGGQLLSASLFDDQNIHLLSNTLPDHIHSNSDNEQFILFTEMVAHHFDNIWNYIESINDINKAESSLTKGISKTFIFDALQNTGIPAFDQFENTNLFEYLLGDIKDGTFQYTTTDGTTMVTASNAGSIPKSDITKEIWKRLYHNAPYLLKTKGTERGIKALMACYGIPETILHIKEYGGPTTDKTGFKTFSYPKKSKALRMSPYGNTNLNGQIKILSNNVSPDTKTIQFRFKPDFESSVPGYQTIFGNFDENNDNNSYESFSVNIIKSTGSYLDENLYGYVTLKNINDISSTEDIPIYNGDMWNFTLIFDSSSTNDITLYCTNTNFNKNTYIVSTSLNYDDYFGNGWESIPESRSLGFGTSVIGGNALYPNGGPTEGNYQEIRLWNEALTQDTILVQSLSPFNYNGNSISSSYESLYLRLPLGSDLFYSESNYTINNSPNPLFRNIYSGSISASVVGNVDFISMEETHHLITPDTVGSSINSEKVRIDTGTIDNDWLSPFQSIETSPQDRQPLDYSDLGIFFSPTFEINEDIIYTLGGFRLDDYIGDPTHYTSSYYPALREINQIYSKKLERRYNFYDYIRTIQFFDHTLFKVIKSFTPAKANLKTGLVIEPHYLERSKIPGKNITKEHINEHTLQYVISGSISSTNETEYLLEISPVGYVESGSYGVANENVAQRSRLSNRFFR